MECPEPGETLSVTRTAGDKSEFVSRRRVLNRGLMLDFEARKAGTSD